MKQEINKKPPNKVVIPPKGKRKKNIVFIVHFADPGTQEQEDLQDLIALQMANFGLFDPPKEK